VKMKWTDMSDLKNLLSRLTRQMNETLGQSDQIKSYLNKMNDSLVLIKRCFVIIVFLAGLMVYLTE
jgi:hypothetical protein